MRPALLNPLFKSLANLPGIGEIRAQKLAKRIGKSPLAICFNLPHGVENREFHEHLVDVSTTGLQTFTAQIIRHKHQGKRYEIRCKDVTGTISLIYFNGQKGYLEKLLPPGETRLISGKVDWYKGKKQMIHPHHVGPVTDKPEWSGCRPLYPMAKLIGEKVYLGLVQRVLNLVPALPEWISAEKRNRHNWPSFREALLRAHAPKSAAELLPTSLSRQRLAYDEVLAYQLAMGLLRAQQQNLQGIAFSRGEKLEGALSASVPFTLTAGQKKIIEDIRLNMAQPTRMMSLLMGDVGSGKTIVSIYAMLGVLEAHYQVAFLAPTEILAQQQYETLSGYLSPLGIEVTHMQGKMRAQAKRTALENISSGKAQVIVGTHALFQEDVSFYRLGFVIIDEQHRFGVEQRLSLIKKGNNPDVLLLSATPIPRTLLLTMYGEMTVHRLKEKPKNRLPISTHTLPIERLDEVEAAVKRMLEKGGKVYWVCPMVQENEESDLMAVTTRFEHCEKIFGSDKVFLLHGQMPAEEKEKTMKAFKEHPPAVLVATTVVEVGVDIPQAQVMVVEHAERFGLAQLHQLRGRVGRNDLPCSCILLYKGPLSETQTARLHILKETQDGFRIAEEDLRLRGGGEILGTRQSGLPQFLLADAYDNFDLLNEANEEAQDILNKDPYLTSPRGEALQILLHLFGHEEGMLKP